MNVLTIKAVHSKRIAIDQYAGPVTTVILSCMGDDGNYTLRLVLREDLRTFMEVGGDELRIDDLAEVEPATLKFGGRYRFEWWIDGKAWVSFGLDDFTLLTSRSEEHVRNWVTTDRYLEAASREVEAERLARYTDLLSDNELELALDELEGIGYEAPRSASYWQNLLGAADNMGLDKHAARYRRRADEANRRR